MTLSKTASTTRSQVVQLIAPAETDAVQMGVDMKALAHILDRLTDLYPNPIEATVREVISNAYDATVLVPEADRVPVRVTTPSMLDSHFVVEDFGVGMSEATVRDIYSQYGASTKGTDFRQIGAYGLGAKAPLSYCTEFFVETTRDGITTAFKVSRETKGNFTTITEVRPTGRPNGTKVTIPARGADAERFQRAVNVYATYGFAVPLEVNGQAADPAQYLPLTDAFLLDEEAGLTGTIWAHRDHLAEVLTARLVGEPSEHAYLLSGWLYRSPAQRDAGYGFSHARHFARGGRDAQAAVLVELKPGVVDFSSSRDDITLNERSRALNDRVRTYLKSEEGLEVLLRAYRTLPAEAAQAIFTGLSAQVKSFTRDELTFHEPGRRTVGVSVKLSSFVTEAGYDPTELYFTSHQPSVWTAFALDHDSRYSYITHLAGDRLKTFTDTGLASDSSTRTGEALVKQVEKGRLVYDLPTVVNALTHNRRRGYGHARKGEIGIMVVTVESAAQVKTAYGYRRVLAPQSVEDEVYMVFAQAGPALTEQVSFLARHKRGEVTVCTFEELKTQVKALRAAAKPKEEAPLALSCMTKGEASITDILKAGWSSYSSVERSPAELKAENAILIVAPTSRPFPVLMGAHNAGLKLTDRPVYVLYGNRTELKASHLQEFKGYDGLLLSPEFRAKSKIAEELKAAHTYHDEVLNEEIMGLAEATVARGFMSARGSVQFYRRVKPALASLASPELQQALALLTAKEDRRARFASTISEAQLRLRLPEVAPALIALRSALDDLTAGPDLTATVVGTLMVAYTDTDEADLALEAFAHGLIRDAVAGKLA